MLDTLQSTHYLKYLSPNYTIDVIRQKNHPMCLNKTLWIGNFTDNRRIPLFAVIS